MDVQKECNQQVNEEDLVVALEHMIRMAAELNSIIVTDNVEVGMLTALPRPIWANIRNELIKDSMNFDSLRSIEESICVICLDKWKIDENTPGDSRDQVSMAEQILYGGKDMVNSSNRCSDGVWGMNTEISSVDGIVINRLVEDLIHYTVIKPFDIHIFHFHDYGDKLLKLYNVSPDVFVQISLHFTYYKLNQCLCVSYEPVSTRRFHLGRTDALKSNIPETLNWIKAMMDKNGNSVVVAH
ncbi:unnamed protein product [Didymodactylos carnosus]|uniref:Choline O-acetyltransferase n=2 Tax=Didymodactylos carnosus TaxID=1234261 RepID=A0A814BIM0_9BILA|nr:unnamed protein product [Didymodactylos carnosus]CAF3707162.1 unnamed protein product [Didymodactylos carnosus]